MNAYKVRARARAKTLAVAAGLLMAGVSTQALAQSVCTVTPTSQGGLVCTNPTGPFVGTVSTASTIAAGAPAITTDNSAAAQSLTVGSAATAGANASGVSGTTVGPLTLNTGTVSTTGPGSTAISVNSTNGPLVVNAANTTATGALSNGISATSGGPATVTVGANGTGGVTATGTAVTVTGANAPVVNVAPGATVQGGTGVVVSGPGATVNNAGTIRASTGPAVSLVSLTPSGGLNNTGRIEGSVSVSGLTAPFNNSGTFAASGTSTVLGPFNNSGQITVLPGALGPGSATIVGAGGVTLNNTGTIALANGTAGDVVTIGTAATGGGTLNGGANSRITLDANIGPGALVADRVVATQITGTTTVVLNPTNPPGPGVGVLNPNGTLLVGGTGNGTVVLAGGPFENGFVQFDVRRINGGFGLVGTPALSAYETVKAGAIGAEYWYASADAWSGRLTEVRDVGQARQPGVEFWGHVFGSDKRYSTKGLFNGFGAASNRDLGYRQDFLGAQVGVDVASAAGGGTFVYGVAGGFTGSDARFNTTRNGAYLTGLNASAYAGYVNGGFYANVLGKMDFYEVAWNAPTASFYQEVDGQSRGVMVETGWKVGGPGLFIEPNASLAYVRTRIKDLSTPSARFDFDHGKSVRGKLGARIGTTVQSGGASFTPFIGASAVHEFEGNNRVAFASGDFVLGLKDMPVRDYGLATLGVDASSLFGLNAFIRADYAFDKVHGVGVQGGVRFRF